MYRYCILQTYNDWAIQLIADESELHLAVQDRNGEMVSGYVDYSEYGINLNNWYHLTIAMDGRYGAVELYLFQERVARLT